jgi:hypothetical protein
MAKNIARPVGGSATRFYACPHVPVRDAIAGTKDHLAPADSRFPKFTNMTRGPNGRNSPLGALRRPVDGVRERRRSSCAPVLFSFRLGCRLTTRCGTAQNCLYRFSIALIGTNCPPFCSKNLGNKSCCRVEEALPLDRPRDWPATKHEILIVLDENRDSPPAYLARGAALLFPQSA